MQVSISLETKHQVRSAEARVGTNCIFLFCVNASFGDRGYLTLLYATEPLSPGNESFWF